MDLEKLKKLHASMKEETFSQEVWNPPVGETMVRILPEMEGQDFYRFIFRHWVKMEKFFPITCLRTIAEDCILCQNQYQYAAIIQKVQKRVLVNVKLREEDKCIPGELPQTLFTQVLAIMLDPEYGDITNPEKGTDVKIVRRGQGLQTEYFVMPSRNSSQTGKFSLVDLNTVYTTSKEEMETLFQEIETFAKISTHYVGMEKGLSQENIKKVVDSTANNGLRDKLQNMLDDVPF